MKSFLFFFCLAFPLFAIGQQTISFSTAKFKTGDDPEWKNPNFNDSKWPLISTTVRWEEQGYEKYDGYAWYRFKFRLPSSIRERAMWKDTLSVLLSKIDDVDESFFNGIKIGQTGLLPTDAKGPAGKWDTFRIYNIAADSKFIRWDEDNVIAVRVYDISNGGGMFGPEPSVKMMSPQDAIKLTLIPDKIESRKYHVSIKNISRKDIHGFWRILINEGSSNKTIKTITRNVDLPAFKKFDDSITVSSGGRLEVVSSFKELSTGSVQSMVKVTLYILTPPASPKPKINSPAIFGVRPGSPFLFKIAATGKGNLLYKAANLPNGLTLNETSGIITGMLKNKGSFAIRLTVSNKLGETSQHFIVKAGDRLALTPPMGWNSWNCWGLSVSDEKVKSSAMALVKKGLINHGWSYINIDDGWEEAKRGENGNIAANDKFKDMTALGDWLHDKGLKFGIYSSPGPATCGGYLGSYQHELKDASTYASWGIDYLKYDWCSYEDIIGADTSLSGYEKPYKTMARALKMQPRDIIYSLCQYGKRDVWKWGDSIGGNSWRTTGDIKDNWESVSSIGFGHPELYKYARPGNWNDPDMLVVGKVGGWSGTLRETQLTPDEQYTHISLWCLLSAPLLIGCDLSSLDDFTLNLLTNDEVIAVDQDAAGMQAKQIIKRKEFQIWVKDMNDGSKIIGFFNISGSYQNIRFNFKSIGLTGIYTVRDLWRQKNQGYFTGGYNAITPPHGVTLIKLSDKK